MSQNPPSSSPRPRFSVLITVKDRVEKLRLCLETLLPLCGEAAGELIVAGDGSPPALRDEFAPHLSAFETAGWRARWLDFPHGGPAKTRNRALPECRGELVLFINDDVRLEPGLLRAHDTLHRRRPGHCVMGNTRWAPEVVDSEFMHWVAHHDSFYYLIEDELSATWEYFHTMNLSLDRRWIEGGARFDESFPDPAFEDTELGYRLWKQGMKVGFAYDAALYHVHHYSFESYLAKSRMRGASARRFCELYPELRDRILGEYREVVERRRSWTERLKRFGKHPDPAEEWSYKIARAFLEGWKGM